MAEEKYSKGSVYRHHGTWYARVSHRDEAGKWHSRSRALRDVPYDGARPSVGRRKAEAELDAWRDGLNREAAEQAEREARLPEALRDSPALSADAADVTVTDYLARRVEVALASGSIEASTASGYMGSVRRIERDLGTMRLSELTPAVVQAWIDKMALEGLAPRTIKKHRRLLKEGCEEAFQLGLLKRNPVAVVRGPRSRPDKPNPLSAASLSAVNAWLGSAGAQDRFALACAVALYTGMRRGEACGLRWSDVDLAAGELSVRRSIKRDNAQYYVGDVPKTGASWRTLKMPASLAERVADRRAWAEGLAEELGVDDIDDWYVLGGPDGYLRPDIVSRDWTSLARALRLKGTRGRRPTFHDLRHTFASRLIAAGVDVRTVAALLGHSDASLVLRVYADALPEAKAAAMGRVDEVMGA